MNKLSLLLVLVCFTNVLVAQDWAGDLQRLSAPTAPATQNAKVVSEEATRKNPITRVMDAAITVYQALWSKQLSTRCVYSLSCSRFSREAIRQHGPLKGVVLSADRISRCNGVHYQETSPLWRDAEGKIIDLPAAYHRH